MAKEEANEAMCSPSDELITITISKISTDRPCWTGAHEFRYHDEMYDVVGTMENNNEIIYTCYQDEKEESIVSALIKKVKDPTGPLSSRHSSRKVRREFDKYFSGQFLPASPQQLTASLHAADMLLPHDLFYMNPLTQPPNTGDAQLM